MKRYAIALMVLLCISVAFAIPQDMVNHCVNLYNKISQMNINKINSRLDKPTVVFTDTYDNSAWVEDSKADLIYTGNYLTQVIESQQITPDTWVKFTRYVYTITNDRVTFVSLEMNSNFMNPTADPIWVQLGQFTFMYNANNHIEHMYMQMANPGGAITSGNRVHYIYNNGVIQFMYSAEYHDESETWSFEKNEIFMENGKYDHMIIQTSPDSTTWTNSEYETCTYDASDTSTYPIFQDFLDHSNFFPVYYTPDFPGIRVNLTETKTWNGTAWVDAYRKTFTYDTNWNVIQQFNEVIDGTTWGGEERTVITYASANRMESSIESNWESGSEMNYRRNRLEYGTGSTDITAPNSNFTISSYPNPFKNDAIVSIKSVNTGKANIQLYDVKGRKIASHDVILNNNNEINLSQIDSQSQKLASGIYFIKVTTPESSICKKIIKIK